MSFVKRITYLIFLGRIHPKDVWLEEGYILHRITMSASEKDASWNNTRIRDWWWDDKRYLIGSWWQKCSMMIVEEPTNRIWSRRTGMMDAYVQRQLYTRCTRDMDDGRRCQDRHDVAPVKTKSHDRLIDDWIDWRERIDWKKLDDDDDDWRIRLHRSDCIIQENG